MPSIVRCVTSPVDRTLCTIALHVLVHAVAASTGPKYIVFIIEITVLARLTASTILDGSSIVM